MTTRRYIPGTNREVAPGYELSAGLGDAITATVSFWLAPKSLTVREKALALMATPFKDREYYSLKQLQEEFGPDEDIVAEVKDFAQTHQLKILYQESGSRLLSLAVPLREADELFEAKIAKYISDNMPSYWGRTGSIGLSTDDFPSEETFDKIQGVFGLDNRPQAKQFSTAVEPKEAVMAAALTKTGFPPPAYNFPPPLKSASVPQPAGPATPAPTSQVIGVIGFGNTITLEAVQAKSPGAEIVMMPAQSISQRDERFMTETLIDVSVIHACAPQAQIVIYSFDETDHGWISGLNSILQSDNPPSVLSISWGWPEVCRTGVGQTLLWTQASVDAIEDLLAALTLRGVTVVVSSGDFGPRVCYPATSAFVLACGGTRLSAKNESAWSDATAASGGGMSTLVKMPDWQTQAGIHCTGTAPTDNTDHRCIPDVAASAFFGQAAGTSIAAPLWAAVIALINEQIVVENQSSALGMQRPLVGNINALLYKTGSPLQAACTDVTTGNNALPAGNGTFYSATPKWDACTGWGSPKVSELIAAILSAA